MNRKLPASNREADIWAQLMRSQKAELSTEAAEFLMAIGFEGQDKNAGTRRPIGGRNIDAR
jgi:hypothetical protein